MLQGTFLVVVDYQHGGYGFLVSAPSIDELRESLGIGDISMGIEIIDSNIDQHPLVEFLGDSLPVYDLDAPTGVLLTLLRQVQDGIQRRSSP